MSFIINNKKVTQKRIDAFWARVEILGSDECWEWQAGLNSRKKGFDYGIFYINGKGVLTHRLAASIKAGKFVGDKHVRHTCDNCRCCNPNHLIPGTHADNMQDKVAKGRCNSQKGEDRPNSKLDENKVRTIRRLTSLRTKYLKFTKAYFARKYGVDPLLITRVITKQAWKHVE